MELKRKDFVGWLRSGALARVVGRTNASVDCPIAMYLRSTGLNDVVVYPTGYGIEQKFREHQVWAKKFISDVDNMSIEFNNPVTSSEALKILGEPTDENYLVIVIQQGEVKCRQPR